MQDISGDGKIGAIHSCAVGFRACEPVLCAGFGYYSIYNSRHADLFIASSVFIGPAVVSSVLSVVLKSGLIARRVAQRRQAVLQRLRDAEERRSRSSGRGQGPMRLEMLLQYYVLRRDKQAYEVLKSANDRRRYEGYSTMLAIATEACSPLPPCFFKTSLSSVSINEARFRVRLPQDLPLGIINARFLLLEVDGWGRCCTALRCSGSYDGTTFTVLLLVLLTSIVCLTYKLMKLLTLPELWHERNRLRSVKAKLAERARLLEVIVLAPESGDSDVGGEGEVDAASQEQLAKGNTLDGTASGSSPPGEQAVAAVNSQGALGRDSTQPTYNLAAVVIAFEIGLLPECGR
jgi:hypothetical protein